MKLFHLVLIVCALLLLQSCATEESTTETTAPISMKWEVLENNLNEKARLKAAFSLTNHQSKALENKDWRIYFSSICTGGADTVYNDMVSMKQINGDFFQITPNENFPTLKKGETATFMYEHAGWCIKYSSTPIGGYIAFLNEDGTEQTPIPFEIENYIPDNQIKRNNDDKFPVATAAYRYKTNNEVKLMAENEISPIIPTPIKYTPLEGTFQLSSAYTIFYQKGLENEAAYLSTAFADIMEGNFKMVETDNPADVTNAIILQIDSKLSNEAAYFITANQNIEIEGGDKAGVFYGIQSLLSAMPTAAFKGKQKTIQVPAFEVEDAPRFEYRGLHLDVSRNFHPKSSVLKLLDVMALYKLNKFHFHLTDDEGWRIEIDGLPELTTVGANRAHTLDEKKNLFPAYGSGSTTDSYGSGFYTKADFIEILKYAQQRHIEVIPEIDLPGHARAALKAMDAYGKRQKAAGKENTYAIGDPDDKSEYTSAQNYHDNVICVCQESTYKFLEKVTDEVIAMYEAANIPLNALHIGGDEVPHGSWGKSPICEAFMAKNKSLKNEDDLTQYFFQRFGDILNKKGLKVAGWEEIGLKKVMNGETAKYVPNPKFVDKNFVPYVWNSVYGWGREDIGYQLANAGYKVILCNASNLYFDCAYDKDPNEPGLYWAGFVNTRKAFDFMPENLFATAKMGSWGDKLDPVQMIKGTTTLKKPENVLGIQGHLWSETLKGQDKLEYYVLPKLFGLAERAWVQQPNYDLLDEQWNAFTNAVGQREFGKLDILYGGFNYRIEPPGAIVKKDLLYANTNFPGLTIRYTTDGSEPTMNSAVYEKPVEVPAGNIKLKVFNTVGRSSRTVQVK